MKDSVSIWDNILRTIITYVQRDQIVQVFRQICRDITNIHEEIELGLIFLDDLFGYCSHTRQSGAEFNRQVFANLRGTVRPVSCARV